MRNYPLEEEHAQEADRMFQDAPEAASTDFA
jgi:hypothetical protein